MRRLGDTSLRSPRIVLLRGAAPTWSPPFWPQAGTPSSDPLRQRRASLHTEPATTWRSGPEDEESSRPRLGRRMVAAIAVSTCVSTVALAHGESHGSVECLAPAAGAKPAVASGAVSSSTAATAAKVGATSIAMNWYNQDRKKKGKERDSLSWKTTRSDRSRVVVRDEELKRIAALINKLVDLPFWSEEQEQELFENAVADCLDVISSTLPPPFFDILHTPENGLGKEQRVDLTKNLVTMCRSHCLLPYLDEQDKRRIIRAVVYILVDAMGPGKDIASLSSRLVGSGNHEEADSLIVHILMAGAIDVFFDDEMRKELVNDVTSYIKELPFMPASVLNKAVERILLYFGGNLREALHTSYKVYKDACANGEVLPVLPEPLAHLEEERAYVLEVYKDLPFVIQLRRIFVTRMLDEWDCSLSFWSGPLRLQTRFTCYMVDLVFKALPTIEKLEHSVTPWGVGGPPLSKLEQQELIGDDEAGKEESTGSWISEKSNEEVAQSHKVAELQRSRTSFWRRAPASV